ncbi:hypothetical protein K3Z84_24595, partial [Pseudomonas aeruginosa]|nr:hypothetical protein [Pseudomonas aeruginosa]
WRCLAFYGSLFSRQITEGLEPGDRVIVGGLAAVQPGVKIVPKPDGAQTQAQSSVPQQ